MDIINISLEKYKESDLQDFEPINFADQEINQMKKIIFENEEFVEILQGYDELYILDI